MKPFAIHRSPELAACVDVATSVSKDTLISHATKRASKRKIYFAFSAIKSYVGGLTELNETFEINLGWQIIYSVFWPRAILHALRCTFSMAHHGVFTLRRSS